MYLKITHLILFERWSKHYIYVYQLNWQYPSYQLKQNQHYDYFKIFILLRLSFLGLECKIYCRFFWIRCLWCGSRLLGHLYLCWLRFRGLCICRRKKGGNLVVFRLLILGRFITSLGLLRLFFIICGFCIRWILRSASLLLGLILRFLWIILSSPHGLPKDLRRASNSCRIRSSLGAQLSTFWGHHKLQQSETFLVKMTIS